MRSAIVIPVALSLALHAGLAWLAARVVLPPRDMPTPADLTIALIALPAAATAVLGSDTESLTATRGGSEVRADPILPQAPAVAPESTSASAPSVVQPETPPAAAALDRPAALVGGSPDPLTETTAPPDPVSDDRSAGSARQAGVTEARPDAAPATAQPETAPLAADTAQALAVPSSIAPADAPHEDAAVQAAPDAPEAAPADVTPPATVAMVQAEPSASIVALSQAAADAPPLTEVAPVPAATASSAAALSEPISAAKAEQAPALDSASQPPLPSMAAIEAPLATVPDAPAEKAQSIASSETDDPEASAAIARAQAFIADYDGGPCYALAAERLAEGVADVDGFAAERTAFDPFDASFSARMGFGPHVTGQVIWKPQCPAVNFLRRAFQTRGPQPALRLASIQTLSGGWIEGRVGDPAHRPLHLFWISEKGAVEDLSDHLVRDGDLFRFRINLPSSSSAKPPPPQMLVALAGALPPMSAASKRDASVFFDALAAASPAKPPAGAAAKLFLLGE